MRLTVSRRNEKANKAPSNEYGLSEKQQIFVREYLIDLNASAAYKRAGNKDSPSAERKIRRD